MTKAEIIAETRNAAEKALKAAALVSNSMSKDDARQKINELKYRLDIMEMQGHERMNPSGYRETVKQYEKEIKRLQKFL